MTKTKKTVLSEQRQSKTISKLKELAICDWEKFTHYCKPDELRAYILIEFEKGRSQRAIAQSLDIYPMKVGRVLKKLKI